MTVLVCLRTFLRVLPCSLSCRPSCFGFGALTQVERTELFEMGPARKQLRMTHLLLMVCLSAMYGLVSSMNETATNFGVPRHPTYVIVLSRQRSSSTTTSQIIGSHPCALFGNEIWGVREQDILGAHEYANMTWSDISDDAHRFLATARDHICSKAISDGTLPDDCGGQCTIVVKLFDIHGISDMGLDTLMRDESMEFVVLERDVEGEFCSHEEASVHNDWGTVPGAHKLGEPHVDCEVVPDDFIQTHDDWFARIRSALHRHGRSFVDVPFSLIASCRLKEFAQSMFGRMGFPLPVSISYKFLLDQAFTECES